MLNKIIKFFHNEDSRPTRHALDMATRNQKDQLFATQVDLPCCALSMLRAGNDTPIECIQKIVEELQSEAKQRWNTQTWGGQRAIFCVSVHPHEMILESNLEKLEFKKIYEFDRRNGYPNGKCWMWILSW